MRQRTLGRTGLTVSEIGFGGTPIIASNYVKPWDATTPDSQAQVLGTIRYAAERGITLFDTSQCYGDGRSEELYGRGLVGLRDKVVIATKTGWRRDMTAQEINRRFEESLRRLRTDYVDLMQFHGDYPDVYTPEDVDWILNGGPLAALQRLQRQGKIRYLGISSEDATALIPLVESEAFDAIQVRYNVIYQQAYHQLLPACAAHGVGVLVMRPNTSGLLQKQLHAWDTTLDAATDWAAFCINYVLSDTRVTCALVGARRRETIDANVALSDDLSRRFDLDELHDRRVGPDHQPKPWAQPI